MSTTQVFVELLITGFGGLIWIILFVCELCGFNISAVLFGDYPTILIFPISGIAYIIGILVDRIGYQIFIKHEKKHIPGVFQQDNEKVGYPMTEGEIYVELMIAYIMQNSEQLKAQIDYNRTRLRLCRSWILNFGLIFLSLVLPAVASGGVDQRLFVVFSILSLLLGVASFTIWKKLAKDYYVNIKTSYDVLKNQLLENK